MGKFEGFNGFINPTRMVGYSLAGILFLILGVQVLFPEIRIPFVGIIIAAMTMVDFIYHEMGHVVFSFFGEFLTVLGGTLAQLFIPVICLLLSIHRRQLFYISLFSFWVGQSLLQVSTYIKDARTERLELFSPGTLLGGSEPLHDWHYLLDKTGLLWADQILGGMVFIFGLLLIFGSALFMFSIAVNLFQRNSSE